jgi:hypothetical protein
MNPSQQVARRYYDAWTSGDRHTVTTLLAPAFRFAAGDLRIDGREAFLASGAFPRDATVTWSPRPTRTTSPSSCTTPPAGTGPSGWPSSSPSATG